MNVTELTHPVLQYFDIMSQFLKKIVWPYLQPIFWATAPQ